MSGVPVPPGSDFPIENLPYGVFDPGDGPRIGVAIGEHVLDLRAARPRLPASVADALAETNLNPFLELGLAAWSEARWAATSARCTKLADFQ